MHGWRDLVCSSLMTVITGVVLVAFPDRPVDIPAGVALVVALAVLARSALRLAAGPTRRQATSTRPRQD